MKERDIKNKFCFRSIFICRNWP